MSHGNRHFGRLSHSKEDIIVLGYRLKTNEVMVCVPAALGQEDAIALRQIAMKPEAQSADYLMEYVLKDAHHPTGVDWQHYVIQVSKQNRGSIRNVSLKDVEFFDTTQKAFFAGYGPSIEPDMEKRRIARRQIHEAQMQGLPIPEPSDAEIAARIAQNDASAPAAPAAAAVPAEPVAPVMDANTAALEAVAETLAKLAEGQAAMADAINNIKPAKAAPKPRKPRKPRIPKAVSKASETPVVETISPSVDLQEAGDAIISE